MEQKVDKLSKMSNFGAYILEREGKYILEDERGFATYTYLQDCVYIEDIYVRPEFRKQGVGSQWADAICIEAKENGFRALELMATLTGVKFYQVCGYSMNGNFDLELADGVKIQFVPMRKEL